MRTGYTPRTPTGSSRRSGASQEPNTDLLGEYDYPGNVRELENLIERGVALAQGAALTAGALPPALAERAIQVIREKEGHLPTLEEREADCIRWVLDQSSGNRTRTARILGIDRVSLWRKLKRQGLTEDKGEKRSIRAPNRSPSDAYAA